MAREDSLHVLRRGGVIALAVLAIYAAAPGTATAFKPNVGKYAATAAGTATPNAMTLQVLKRNRTYRTRVLGLSDDCAGSLVPVPLGLGRVFAKDIKFEISGTTGMVSWSAKFEGIFSNAKTLTMRVRSNQNNLAPPPGTPAKICADDTLFTLTFRGGPERKKK